MEEKKIVYDTDGLLRGMLYGLVLVTPFWMAVISVVFYLT